MIKKIFLFILIIFLTNCNGFKPIFNNYESNFYIEDIEYQKNSKILNDIVRRLKPLMEITDSKPIKIKLTYNNSESVISRDDKGDPSIFNMAIEVKMSILSESSEKEILYQESRSFNNQSNKFELQQYKKNIEKNLIENIFEKIFITLKEYK